MKRRWVAVVVLSLVLVFALIPKLVVLPSVARQIRAELQQEFETTQVEVRLSAPWGWELFFGYLPGLEINMREVMAENLVLSQVDIQGEGIKFEPRTLWQEWSLDYQSAENLEGLVTVNEGDLNTFFWQEVDPNRNLQLEIHPSGMSVIGKLALWNTELDFTLHGLVEIWQQSNLRFVPQNLEVQATRVPPFLLEVFNENYDFILALSVFPYPITISEVLMEEGQMLIKIGVLQ